MEISSLGSPLMTLATFSFAIILSFSSSVVLSQPTSNNQPPSVHRHPPPKDSHLLHAPRPMKGNWNHPPHRPWHPLYKKHGELVKPKNRGLNKGKLVGLLFAGFFVVMQIGVVSFLVYKKNQIYKIRD